MATTMLMSNSELTELAACARIAAAKAREEAAAQSCVATSITHERVARYREELAEWLEAARHYPPV